MLLIGVLGGHGHGALVQGTQQLAEAAMDGLQAALALVLEALAQQPSDAEANQGIGQQPGVEQVHGVLRRGNQGMKALTSRW